MGLRVGRPRTATPELRDTLQLWNVKAGDAVRAVWLDETQFNALPRAARATIVREQLRHGRGGVPTVRAWSDLLDARMLRAQADGHRFLWWPSLVGDDAAEEVLRRVVEHRRLRSRHREVPKQVWRRSAHVVPGAQRLAGTFPTGSGPNCFGTVLAGCGVSGVEDEWLLPPAFEDWLAENTHRGGDDERPGTILVWRDRAGLAQHAAVTLGDGWVFEKPSQEWSSPRAVAAVRDVIRVTRFRGLRLSRHSVRS